MEKPLNYQPVWFVLPNFIKFCVNTSPFSKFQSKASGILPTVSPIASDRIVSLWKSGPQNAVWTQLSAENSCGPSDKENQGRNFYVDYIISIDFVIFYGEEKREQMWILAQ